MKTRSTVALSMLTGIGLGAVAVQGIHAQTKPQPLTYYIAEIEVTNLDGYPARIPAARRSQHQDVRRPHPGGRHQGRDDRGRPAEIARCI